LQEKLDVKIGSRRSTLVDGIRDHPYASASVVAVAALAVSALVNRELAAKAERDNPPRGRFVEIDGVRLHYVERGSGDPLVLLHGNGSMIQDFESSGLLDMAAAKYRVIAFDRPGYGHTPRPRDRVWSPEAQADLIDQALRKLGASPAVVLGHSWGASVAMALALRHPSSVRALVPVSGYYYPTPRVDAIALSGPAIPIVGDILRYTLAPLLGRALWRGLMRKIFGPAKVPAKFADGFPRALALRPSQLRASAAESALMVPEAWAASDSYSALRMPVVIVAGASDRLIDTAKQSARLHDEIPHSSFHAVPEAGHMVHQTATRAVMAAINEAATTKEDSTSLPPNERRPLLAQARFLRAAPGRSRGRSAIRELRARLLSAQCHHP
jgi:pimeloyl-ACP methyl ester carboxylesterase